MILPVLKRITVASTAKPQELARQILQFLDYVVTSLSPLLASPRARTNVIETRLVYALDGFGNPIPNVVNHLLQIPAGKTPDGWCVIDKDAATDIYRTAWDTKTISLVTATVSTNIKLEVW